MTDITSLKGIGETRAKIFRKKNINTVEDLLYYFPRAYEDRSAAVSIDALTEDMTACVAARVFSPVKEARIRKNMAIYSMKVADDSGVMSVVWYNNRYVKGQFRTGDEYIFYGKVTKNRNLWEMANPIYEKPQQRKYTGRIMPIYPLSAELTQKIVQNAAAQALTGKKTMTEYLPEEVRKEYKLAEINYAIRNIHFPKDAESIAIAHRRLAFEELFFLQLALLEKKSAGRQVKKEPFKNIECKDGFIASLPFRLTDAQKRVTDEICADLTSGKLMMRLVQGDVGSGKTAVAAIAVYLAAKNGFQSAIMAPTEILAAQHFETFSQFFENSGFRLALLTGSTKKKKDLYAKIESGEIDIVIGTHAVIQNDVGYKNLGLVVADEQHRFGVAQRAALSEKGDSPHCLVMTATPIPRTLGLILCGDLDISVLDELPPGRKKVKTFALGEGMRTRINAFLEKNIKSGSQAYVVCPLVEETASADLQNATDKARLLAETFPDFRVGLIHGKMKAKDKDAVMESFINHELDILVSTTVIEVGVNVPNSNIIIIENAERFGLAQLHQLRGRVGRGSQQAYCIMFAKNTSDIIKKRMETMCKSNDGFYISEQDLKLRGPGDFFGTRQHGLPEMKIANLAEDINIMKEAQSAAEKIMKNEYHITGQEKERLYDKMNSVLPRDIVIN